MNLKNLTDEQLLTSTKSAVQTERDAATNVIRHFQEIYDRRLYLPAHTSMFEMLRGEYSYCAGSAQIRLNAMNLIRDVPAVEAKIESGEMSLTVAANVQSFLRLEKKNARPYSENAKIELVETCTGKSALEVEREFARRNPEIEKRESVRFTSDDRVRVSHSLSVTVEDKIQRIKELWSHVDPNMSREQILDRMTEIVLEQIDPLRKAKRSEERKVKRACSVNTAHSILVQTMAADLVNADSTSKPKDDSKEKSFHVPETHAAQSLKREAKFHSHETRRSRYIAASANDSIHLANGDQGCAHVDPKTGKRCGSQFQLQRDHIYEFALGGSNKPENLRLLCAQHNRWRNRSQSLIKTGHLVYG